MNTLGKIKFTFLGSGSAFTHDNYHSNMLLEVNSGKKLLIDCGSDARHSTAALDISSKDIDAVYISHFHADHVGGLEWLALTTKFDEEIDKPTLIIQPSMKETLWDSILSGGLQTIQDTECNLETYFNILPFKNDREFVWEGISFHLVKTIHYYSNNELAPSYGLFFKLNGTQIFLSTDTQYFPDHYKIYLEKSHIIFHECETSANKSGVHTHFSDIKNLSQPIKEKMWLYHYDSGVLPDAKSEGFRGFVKKQQKFEF